MRKNTMPLRPVFAGKPAWRRLLEQAFDGRPVGPE